MQPSLLSRGILTVAICSLASVPLTLAQSTPNSASAQALSDLDPNDPERQQAIQLYRQHKMPEIQSSIWRL